MHLFRRSVSLPLGVDLSSHGVSIVAAEAAGDGFVVRETCTREVPAGEPARLDRRIAETLRSVLATLATRERRCVLAAAASDVVTRAFRVPPGMGRSEAERAAALEAGDVVDWSEAERVVALDPIPDKREEMLLSVARHASVERLVALARGCGLKPIAVDVPACAWRRAVPDADALLACQGDRAELVIFGQAPGSAHLYPPRLIEDRLASQVRAALGDARRDGVADVQRLAILTSRSRFESLSGLLRDDGYVIAPVMLGDLEAPAWTFAYGLASWSIAPRGLVHR